MSIKDRHEQKFINIVSRHPIVYNTAHLNYRNNVVKELAWRTIAKEIGKDVEECKKKWKCVRDGYNRFKKNRLMTEGSPNPKNSKKYRHNQLSFLDGLHNDSSTIEYPEVVYNEEYIDEIEYKNVTLLEDDDIYSDNTDTKYESKDSEQDADNNSDSNEDVKSIKNRKAKSKTLKRNNPHTTRKDIQNDQHRNNSNAGYKDRNNTRKSDDVEYFCRHIAEVLRNLPPLVKARAKQHLNTVLSEYEIMAAQESSTRDDMGTTEQES